MKRMLVLRPEPGASLTIAAARRSGFDAIGAPLFTVEGVAWRAPPGPHDALMLTSANAVRWGGEALYTIGSLPTYAVGEATAAAARGAGLDVVHVGTGGAAALLAEMRGQGVRRALHLAGEVHRDVRDPAIMIDRVIVYRSVPSERWDAPIEDAVALLHSPSAACLFAQRIDAVDMPRDRIAIAAISPAAATAAGEGWAAVAVASQPTDAALLAVAAKLCEEEPTDADGRA